LTVCKVAGIDSKLAEQGVFDFIKDVRKPLTPLNFQGKEILFLNAFAVNDVDSTDFFIKHWQRVLGKEKKVTVLFNTRADRPLRSILFAEWIANIPLLDQVIVFGDHSERAKRSLLKSGLKVDKVQIWNKRTFKNFKENLLAVVADDSLVIGVGNISGNGFLMLNELIHDS